MAASTAPLSLDTTEKPRFFDAKTENFNQINRYALSVMENLFASEGDCLMTSMTDAEDPSEVRRKLLFTMQHQGRVNRSIDGNYPQNDRETLAVLRTALPTDPVDLALIFTLRALTQTNLMVAMEEIQQAMEWAKMAVLSAL